MKSIYNVEWSLHSKKEFAEVFSDISLKWSEEVLIRFIQEVDHTIELLKRNPYLFQKSISKPKLRRAAILSLNKLYFTVDENSKIVYITSFFLSRMNPNETNNE